MPPSITTIEFRNYKAFSQFWVHLEDMNILVGPNNSGKSTIIGAFRILAAGLRRARSKKPERILINNEVQLGYPIPQEEITVSTENVHTNYAEVDSSITFRASNGNRLRLIFPTKGGCFLIPELERGIVASPTTFRSAFPISLVVVPVLGPLEHDEDVVQSETVQRNLGTHRASRHFRNYWHYFPDGFEKFSQLVESTWPGMQIQRPEADQSTVQMYCLEERMTRELYWAGFGFQIWCQLLTYVARTEPESILVIDEPEIYLHPDLQRQLVSILRSLDAAIVLATHSTEIMTEADPSEVLLIDKKSRSAERLKDVAQLQVALDEIGSVQNIGLTRLAKHKKLVYVEGGDWAILMRFARLCGLSDLATATEIIPAATGGFSGWTKARAAASVMTDTFQTKLSIACILDRDYHPAEEITDVRNQLLNTISLVHIHEKKEIENYLLVPEVLWRAIRSSLRSEPKPTPDDVRSLLHNITSDMKLEVTSQYVGRRVAYLRSQRLDSATAAKSALEFVEDRWSDLDARLTIVPGKEVLRRVRDEAKSRWGVTLTLDRILGAFRVSEVSEELRNLLQNLEQLRLQRIS